MVTATEFTAPELSNKDYGSLDHIFHEIAEEQTIIMQEYLHNMKEDINAVLDAAGMCTANTCYTE